ncbi:hypothetical protein ASD50_21120 [Mesorhizobium sp. Root552]|jgi:hypothetical protein|nr:hypothetical protein ASD50_21120 [Mesorhizobium sp. Root552]
MLPIPKWHANRTPVEIEEKVLHHRSKYHLGPTRIVWYLARLTVAWDAPTVMHRVTILAFAMAVAFVAAMAWI